jgi:pimeloyl-ACP methyl ester carboxylesterase
MITPRTAPLGGLLEQTFHWVQNGAGFDLSIKRVALPGKPKGRPVIFVPGYGMNTFIFGFHPNGVSMEEHLARAGLEVFSVDLRGQGRTLAGPDAKLDYGLAELGVDDVRAAIRRVLEVTKTGAKEVDLVGVSLGTTFVFAHLACTPDSPVRCIVSMGGLVTWVKIHPLLRLAFASPALIGRLQFNDARGLAKKLLPVLAHRAPKLLSVYMHAKSTDLSQADVMAQTVENPNPNVNRDIARWIGQRELIVRGVNVSRKVPAMTFPLLCFVAREDGIVPPETARWPYDAIGSSDKELIEVGTDETPIAHADLFVSRISHEAVFTPLARFLTDRA